MKKESYIKEIVLITTIAAVANELQYFFTLGIQEMISSDFFMKKEFLYAVLLHLGFGIIMGLVISTFVVSVDKERKKRQEELEDAYEQLKRKDELKSRFIQIASHEFRTPLAIVRGYVDLLKSRKNTPLKEQKWLAKINEGVGRLTNMIENLLSASTMEKTEWMEQNTCNLSNILSRVRAVVDPFVEDRGLSLDINVPEKMNYRCYDDEIFAIFYQLITNAIKFTPDGGEIEVSGEGTSDGYLFKVRDTGIGISKDDLELIFEPFYEVQDPMKHHSGTFEFMSSGAGIGLTICRRFVERHKGKIWAESEVGEGSTFYVSFINGE